MKKQILVVMISVLLLFSLGVQGCEKKDDGSTATGAYVGGSQGLVMSFVQDEPPVEVLDENKDPFSITLLLENKGEAQIPKGKVIASLKGIDSEAFSLISLSAKSDESLEGTSKGFEGDVSTGDQLELTFDEAQYKPDISADFTIPFNVDVCYLYQTEASTSLCLKKIPVKEDEDDICQISASVTSESSGAPVQVKSITQRSAGSDELQFTFTIANVGGGEIYGPAAFAESCGTVSDQQDKVMVRITAESRDIPISCSKIGGQSSGEVKLISGEKTISCNVKTSRVQDVAFIQPFKIQLDYFYKNSLSRSITVKDSNI